jgi:quercetin dioxygenase-like cupin family protein
MSVKYIDNIPSEAVPNAVGVSKQVLISAEEAPHFAMRCFTIQPGGKMPLHTNTVEHEQYVLSGRAKVTLGDEHFKGGAGNVVFIPAGVPHAYTNIGEEPFRFLCSIPNLEDYTTYL